MAANNDEKAFLAKHLHNWERNRNGNSALTLVAENADKKLNIEFTPELLKAADSVVCDIMKKATDAAERNQISRGVILCLRGMKACQRLENGFDGVFRNLLADCMADVLAAG